MQPAAPHHHPHLEVCCVEKSAHRPQVRSPLGKPLPDQGLRHAQAHPRTWIHLLLVQVNFPGQQTFLKLTHSRAAHTAAGASSAARGPLPPTHWQEGHVVGFCTERAKKPKWRLSTTSVSLSTRPQSPRPLLQNKNFPIERKADRCEITWRQPATKWRNVTATTALASVPHLMNLKITNYTAFFEWLSTVVESQYLFRLCCCIIFIDV